MTFEKKEITKERKALIRVLGVHGKAFATGHGDLENFPVDTSAGRYEAQALRTHRKYLNSLQESSHISQQDSEIRTKLLNSGGVLHGFRVMGRILSQAKGAYFEYCQREHTQPDMHELLTLLRSDQAYNELVKFIAEMPGYVNRNYEEAYGLDCIQKDEPLQGSSFVVIAQKGDRLIIFPQENLESSASALSGSWYGKDTFAVCPASKVFLRKLWDILLTDCATLPELFQADISNF